MRQSPTLTGTDFPSFISKTLTGHVFTQVSSPLHLALSTIIFTIQFTSDRSSSKAKKKDKSIQVHQQTSSCIHYSVACLSLGEFRWADSNC